MGVGINFVNSQKIIFGMRKSLFLFVCFLALTTLRLQAQFGNRGPVKVAVFAPLYINDAFNNGTYKLGKNSLPKNILPGLEFYNGVMMAIDSLEQEGASAEIDIYDTKDVADFDRVLQGSALNN